MIEVSNVSFAYNTTTSIRFPDFRVNMGEHCLLLGESGSGKTTLLHLLGGLLRGYSGQIRVGSEELATFSETELDTFRGRKIGFIFQKNHLISALSVEKNLLLSPYLAGLAMDHNRVTEVLTRLDVQEKRKSKISELSHGQAQRVAIARAVLNHPAVILADEPTSALDDTNCDRVIHLLLEAASANQATLLVATHDQRLKSKIQKHVDLLKFI